MAKISDKFPDFVSFWEDLRKTYATYRDFKGIKGQITMGIISFGAYNMFKNWDYLQDEESFYGWFYHELVMIYEEIKFTQDLREKIFSKVDRLFKIRTESRSGASNTSKNVGTGRNIPLVSNVNLVHGQFGAHSRAELGQSETSGNAFVETTTGYKAKTPEGNIVQKPNWSETEDRAGVARILHTYEAFRIEISTYYKRLYKGFLMIYSPSIEYIEDPITGKQRWRTSQEILEEQEELEAETKPKKKETLRDDPNLPTLGRLKIFKNWLESEIKKGGGLKEKQEMRLSEVENYIIAWSADYEIASIENFDSVMDKIIGHKRFKQTFRNYLKTARYKRENNLPSYQNFPLLLGPPGIGKTYICRALGKAMNRPVIVLNFTGMTDPGWLRGIPQHYKAPGLGEIFKFISRNKHRAPIIILDEVEKASRELIEVVMNLTDREENKHFIDLFLDFALPLNELIIISTSNKEEKIPGPLFSRYDKVPIETLSWKERIQTIRLFAERVLDDYKLNEYKSKLSEKLIIRFLNQEWGVRRTNNNVVRFVDQLLALKVDGIVPYNFDDYDWNLTYEKEFDPECPAIRGGSHKSNCRCFFGDKVEGWQDSLIGKN